MILTVTPNAAIDRTVRIARLEPGTRLPLEAEHAQAGGKGVNVARVLQRLGVRVRAIVGIGGAAGRWIVEDLGRAGIPCAAVEAAGESRTCLELIEGESGRVTQIHGAGIVGGEELVRGLERAVAAHAADARWLAVCGSLPPGTPADAVARLVGAGRRAGLRCAVDTSGPALREAFAADPELVRVNREEARAVAAVPAIATDTAVGRPGLVVVSDGAMEFDAWGERGERWRIAPPRVVLRSAIGCGDAMLAGLLAAFLRGAAPEAALAEATALAAAEAESWIAGRPSIERARELLDATRVRRTDPGR